MNGKETNLTGKPSETGENGHPSSALPLSANSGIRDNHTRGTVADFLREKINPGSHLSVVSVYFTIYAYDALIKEPDHAC